MFSFIIIILLLTFDQLSKFLTVKFLNEYQSYSVIDGFLNFTRVHNTGGPWSIFDDKPYIFIIMTIIIFVAGFIYFKKNPPKHALSKISIYLISAGALGNLIDRILRGYVVDMIDVNLFDYPVFNVADCYVVIGAVMMCIYILFVSKEDN